LPAIVFICVITLILGVGIGHYTAEELANQDDRLLAVNFIESAIKKEL